MVETPETVEVDPPGSPGAGAASEPAPDPRGGALSRLSIVRGWPATRVALRQWRGRPLRTVLPWLVLSFAIACVLLVLTWQVALHAPPDQHPVRLPSEPPRHPGHELLRFVRNNLLVLALHAAACLAGFIVYMARYQADERDGARLRAATGAVAAVVVLFVPFATVLSIATQAWILGSYASTIAYQAGVEAGALLRSALPHALVELTAVFLPLAAFLVVGRRRERRSQLLAATIVSVVIAVPMLFAAGWIEAYGWHARVERAVEAHPTFVDRRLAVLEVRVDPATEYVVEASLRDPVVDERFDTEEDAVAAARRHARDDEASAVLRTPQGFVVYEVWGQTFRTQCAAAPIATGGAKPLSLDELDAARLRNGSRGEPLADDRLVALVQGPTVRSFASLRQEEEPEPLDCQ